MHTHDRDVKYKVVPGHDKQIPQIHHQHHSPRARVATCLLGHFSFHSVTAERRCVIQSPRIIVWTSSRIASLRLIGHVHTLNRYKMTVGQSKSQSQASQQYQQSHASHAMPLQSKSKAKSLVPKLADLSYFPRKHFVAVLVHVSYILWCLSVSTLWLHR